MQNTFFIDEATELARENSNFRKVVFTTDRSQLVLMSLMPREEIGSEVHVHIDQIFVVVAGLGEAVIGTTRRVVEPGTVLVVPAGTRHNILNAGNVPLQLFTIYTPPQHEPGTVHRTKAEADAAELAHHR